MKALEGREGRPVECPPRRRRARRARLAADAAGRLDLPARGARGAALELPGDPTRTSPTPPRARSHARLRRLEQRGAAAPAGSRSTRAPASSRRGRRTTTSRTRAGTRARRRARAVVVVGAGPNRIGQAIEFDYCCVHAVQALRKLGYEAVMVNSNPETVSTDYDTSDRLYLEPLTSSDVLDVCELEQPVGVAVSLRRPDAAAARAGARGRGRAAARRPARRDRRRRGPRPLRARSAGDLAPEWGTAADAAEALRGRGADRLPGARAAALRARRARDARRARGPTSCASTGRASSTATSRARSSSTSTRSATATDAWVAAVLEHVEPAGVHSGDSACVLPGPSVSRALEVEIREVATRSRGASARAAC